MKSARPILLLRILRGSILFVWCLFQGACDYVWNILCKGKSASRQAQAHWLQRCSQRHLASLNITFRAYGPIPSAGLIVCNHLSYVDILVISSLTGAVFVSKSDVLKWPVFGWFAQRGGTLFVQREKRGDVARIATQMKGVLDDGTMLVLFPEGTTSDGREVLPFKSSLMEPITQADLPVVAAAVDYRLHDGTVGKDVAYWGDMTLVPHLLNLFTKEHIEAFVTFAPAKIVTGDRKQIARDLQAEVAALKQEMNQQLEAVAATPELTSAKSS